jgi:hypothetical protein
MTYGTASMKKVSTETTRMPGCPCGREKEKDQDTHDSVSETSRRWPEVRNKRGIRDTLALDDNL